MDTTLLRLILLILGLAFLAAIYLYETARRKRDSAQARQRMAPKVEPTIESDAAPSREPVEVDAEEDETPWDDSESFGSSMDEEPDADISLNIDDAPIEAIDAPAGHLNLGADREASNKPSKKPAMEQQELFGFSAQEESPVDVPDLILQINLRAKKEPFTGEAIKQAMQETGMQLSEMEIYQRFASDGSRKVLYNIASMVNPGIFPVKSMADFSTPGLTLFSQLPGPVDGMMIFSDMLYTAERLAAMLHGDLQDESHSTLGKQTIEHMRERILEHKRQIQLARRKG
jgi:cell division protein ZipA